MFIERLQNIIDDCGRYDLLFVDIYLSLISLKLLNFLMFRFICNRNSIRTYLYTILVY